MSEKKVGEAGGAEVTGNVGGSKPPPKTRRKKAADVGRALRSVYDETLREDVPDDFLDLLGKLS